MQTSSKKQIGSRSAWRELPSMVIVGMLAIVVFFALHPSVVSFLSERFLGGSYGDAGLYVWVVRSFVENPLTALRFETNAFYPYPLTRAWSDSFLLPSALVYALMTWAGVSLTAAYNIVLTSALGMNAAASYGLAQRVGVSAPYAAAVGILFANSSFFMGNLGHPQLLFFFWVPLALLAVLPAEGQHRVSARAWFLAGVCMCAAFYSAVYYAIFAALSLAIVWVYELVTGISSPRRALRSVLFASFGALPALYALPAYLVVQGYFGTRGLYEAEAFAATGLSYLSFTPLHAWYGRSASLSHSEAYLGIGYTLLTVALGYGALAAYKRSLVGSLICLVGIVLASVFGSVADSSNLSERAICYGAWVLLAGVSLIAWRERKAAGILGLIVVVFFVLSLGPGGNPVKREPSFAPLSLLYAGFPGISAVRAVGRFGVVVLLGITIAAALGARRIAARFSGVEAGRLNAIGALVFLSIGLIENAVPTVPIDAPEALPAAFVAHADDDMMRGGAAIAVPFSGEIDLRGTPSWSEYATINSQYAVWSVATDGFSIVNGYSGQRPKVQSELPSVLRTFPSKEAFDYIARLCGVGTVLIVPSLSSKFDAQQALRDLDAFQREVLSVTRFGDGSAKVTLKQLMTPINSGESVTLFAPRNTVARLTIASDSTAPCEVKVSTLGRDSIGTVGAIRTDSFSVKTSQEIRLLAPPTLSRASPHVIEVRSEGCALRVGC